MADQSLHQVSVGIESQVAATVTATVRYFAAARAAAGVEAEELVVGVTEGGCTVALLLEAAVDRHGPELSRVLPRCSYLLDEVAVHGTATPVGESQVLDILPPFAGG